MSNLGNSNPETQSAVSKRIARETNEKRFVVRKEQKNTSLEGSINREKTIEQGRDSFERTDAVDTASRLQIL